MNKIISNGKTKIMLYSISSSKAVVSKFCESKVIIAKYGAPVHGSSTKATNAPKNITPGSDKFLERLFILLAYRDGIANVKPLPYQKKSFISISPAKITIEATAIVKYSLSTIGICPKKNTKPRPATT